MRLLLTLTVVCASLVSAGQVYPAENINLLAVSNPNQDSLIGYKYSGCWGWFQEDKKREYALAGGTNGTYFIDVTNPSAPVVCDFVAGIKCIWREIKNYKNYCYVVSQCGGGLQVIDMKYLPDSVHVVSTGTNVLLHGHTLWIDNDRLYFGFLTISQHLSYGFGVYSLSNPELPVFLRGVDDDYSFISAHDLFARNDTIYACDASNGVMVLKYETTENKFRLLGTYSGYPQQGYTHSDYLTENGKYLVFCDEVPAGIPIHLVDVSNLDNIQPVSSFLPYPLTNPHNPYVLGNNWVVVACYQDGLFIYDISDPKNVKQRGFFDTCPLYGFDVGDYGNGYDGNWGAYPFLPSKTIIAIDRMNGVFLLDASGIMKDTTITPSVPLSDTSSVSDCAVIYTVPASKSIRIKARAQQHAEIKLSSPEGKLLYSSSYSANLDLSLNTETLSNGFYILSVGGSECRTTKKILITHFER